MRARLRTGVFETEADLCNVGTSLTLEDLGGALGSRIDLSSILRVTPSYTPMSNYTGASVAEVPDIAAFATRTLRARDSRSV